MSESARFRLGTLGKLVAMIVVAGVLVAGLLFPWVGGTGIAARNSASLLDALPVELTDQTPNGNAKVLAADGTLITEFYEHNRTPVTPDQVAPVMKQALVDIEDSRFYEHNGLDVQGTTRALVTNLAAGEVLEGGSTLTQQLVKQTLLQTADTAEERAAAIEQDGPEGVARKLREARLALALEQTYSKDEILTRYLNIAYFGHGAYGIQAAAQAYFSVNAIDLTLPQASVLAGLVQSPTDNDPLAHPEAAQTRRDQVLNRMHDLGHITDQELADITAGPVQTVEGGRPPNGCAAATIGGFFCAYLKDYLNSTLKLNDTQLDNGGYTIQTTLRPDMQAAGDQGVLNTVGLDSDLIGAYDAIEPGTGHVLAMSVNRTFGCDRSQNPSCESVNFAVVPSKGSGSTFKMFTAAAALEAGKPATYTLTTSEPYFSRVFKKNGGTEGEAYSIGNVGNNYPHTLTMTQGLYMSSNTYFLALEDALGSVEPEVRMAKRLGMTFDASNQKSAQYYIDGRLASFTYGTEPVSPLDLANAYATVAARGTKCEPVPLTQILTSAGQPLTGDDGQPVVKGDQCTPNVIAPGIADTLNQMMRNDVEPGHPKQTAPAAYIPGHQIAGKTGTVNNNDSVAFVGSTPEYTASVMVFRPLSTETVGGYGGGKAATIWHDAMAPILTNQPTAEFPPADPKYEFGDRPPVPSCSSVSECTTVLQGAGFSVRTSTVTSSRPAGTFVGTSPRAGARASKGQAVTIQVSRGSTGRSAGRPANPAPGSPRPPVDKPPVLPPDTNGDGIPG